MGNALKNFQKTLLNRVKKKEITLKARRTLTVLELYTRDTATNTLEFIDIMVEEFPFPIQRIQSDRFFIHKVLPKHYTIIHSPGTDEVKDFLMCLTEEVLIDNDTRPPQSFTIHGY